jgi:DNA-binding PadR family transcriptional regulator
MTRGHAMHQPWEGPAVDPRALSHWLRAMGGGHHGQGRGRGGRGRRHEEFAWGPGGQFPPGFPFQRGRGPRARRGDVRAALLALLAEEPRNGYQLMQEIERRSDGMWRPSPGSVYPALQLLEDEGLVHAEMHDGRREFALTDAGRAHVEAQGDALKEPWRAASEEAGHGMMELRRIIGQVAAAVMQVAVAGSEAQQAEARRILGDTRRALYRILAEDEPDDADDDSGEA